MSHWVAEVVTGDVGWRHLERLADVGSRMAGSEGERLGAEETRDAFREAGARDARLETFPLQGWSRGSSALAHVESGERVDCIALPRSPDTSVAGDLVDVGHGLPEDFASVDVEDRVVVAATNTPAYCDRAVHRREKYRLAVDGGAAGFVFRNHVEGCLAPTGSVGTADSPIGSVPAVGVSKEAGDRLRRRFRGERVRLSVEADIGDARSQNVHASVGPPSDERVLFTTHVDAHDIGEGAMDNGAGTAMLVELANALEEREGDLETRIEFVAFGAEEVGLVGAKHYAGEVDVENVAAIVNLDGVVRGRTLTFFTHEFDVLEEAVRGAAATFDHPVRVVPRAGPPGDQWPFVRRGIPGYFVASERAAEGRGWGHTAADTLDKLDSRNLREQALVLTELAVALADEQLALEPRTLRKAVEPFERTGHVAELQAADEWPYE